MRIIDATGDGSRRNRLAGLSSARRTILERLLARRDPAPPLIRRERVGPPRASFAQQQMWVLDRLMPSSCQYNETRLLTFVRRVDPAVIERCLNEVVRRHDALRTTFVQADGHVIQVIAPEVHVRVPGDGFHDAPSAARPASVRPLSDLFPGDVLDGVPKQVQRRGLACDVHRGVEVAEPPQHLAGGHILKQPVLNAPRRGASEALVPRTGAVERAKRDIEGAGWQQLVAGHESSEEGE